MGLLELQSGALSSRAGWKASCLSVHTVASPLRRAERCGHTLPVTPGAADPSPPPRVSTAPSCVVTLRDA